jgi:hypothetical protein
MESKFIYNDALLAAKFDIAEQYIQDLLCLIVSEKANDSITITLVEGFDLSEKLKLLAKIIRIISIWEEEIFIIIRKWEEEISEMIKRLTQIVCKRDLLKYELCESPLNKDEEITINVRDTELFNIACSRRSWSANRESYKVDQYKNMSVEIDDIIRCQEVMLYEIEKAGGI